MKKFVLLFYLLALSIVTFSQNTSPLKMMGFHKLPDETADLKALKNAVGRDSDLDGNKAALIRVKAQGFDEKIMLDFTPFSRPGIEIIHKKYQDGEMWLYVSSNCQGALVIKYMGEFEFKLPQKLEAKGVYELVLGMETATLVIRVIPDDAEIFIDNEKVGIGYVSKAVAIGSEHRWKVQRAEYVSKEGVKLLTESGEEVMDVELDPSFGYITVNSVPAGADVYIDERKLGVTPYNLKKISLGSHAVELRKYGYVSTGEIVIIKAGENNKQLANVTLERDKNIILQQAGQQTKTTK